MRNIRTCYLFLGLLIIPFYALAGIGQEMSMVSYFVSDEDEVDTVEAAARWPGHYWIAMPKAYPKARDYYDVLLNAYASRNSAFGGKFNRPFPQELWERSIRDSGFVMVTVSDKWHTLMGNRKEFETYIQRPDSIKNYYEYLKKILLDLSHYKQAVINFEPDPFGSFSKIIRGDYDGDPANVPAALSQVDMDEVRELNPPDNFAGFWQVIDYMRKKYAPHVMLAPTAKEWGQPVNILDDVPDSGWMPNSPAIIEMRDYFARYGVDWDALAFNINNKNRTDEEFKIIVDYFTALAKAMGKNKVTQKPVYSFIWKALVDSFHYVSPVDEWKSNEISFEFRNIGYMAERGVRGMVIGYGNQLNDKFAPDSVLPPAMACWLNQYFNDTDTGCVPPATMGLIKVTEYDDTTTFIANWVDTPDLKLSPNPANGFFRINLPAGYNVLMYDTNGRCVLTAKNDTVDVSNLKPGIYLVVVKKNNGKIAGVQKVVIHH